MDVYKHIHSGLTDCTSQQLFTKICEDLRTRFNCFCERRQGELFMGDKDSCTLKYLFTKNENLLRQWVEISSTLCERKISERTQWIHSYMQLLVGEAEVQKIYVYLPYRGTISFYVSIVPLGLINIFLHVERDKISCGLQPTRFSRNLP